MPSVGVMEADSDKVQVSMWLNCADLWKREFWVLLDLPLM